MCVIPILIAFHIDLYNTNIKVLEINTQKHPALGNINSADYACIRFCYLVQ